MNIIYYPSVFVRKSTICSLNLKFEVYELKPAFARRSFSEVGIHQKLIFFLYTPFIQWSGYGGQSPQICMHYVYILLCANTKPYIGCTENLKERFDRHQKGEVPATKNCLPVKLITYFAFLNKYTAFNFEKYLKSGSGRAFIT